MAVQFADGGGQGVAVSGSMMTVFSLRFTLATCSAWIVDLAVPMDDAEAALARQSDGQRSFR